MIKLLIIALTFISSVLISFSNNTKDSNDVVNLNNNSLSIETISNHNVKFNFDEDFITENNVVSIKIIDDYNIIPTITINGNIGCQLLSSNFNENEIELTFPNSDGTLEINLLFDNETIIRHIYSSERDGKYGISALSMYQAKYLVGNLPNQEYMDNDEIEAIYVETPDFSNDREQNNRVIANGSVFGYLRWTDDNNVSHPLIGVKVKLTWDASFGEAYTSTNSSGYFYISFSNMWTLSDYGCYIHIYAENDMVKVTNSNSTLYEKTEKLVMMQNGDNYNYGTYTFSPTQDNDMGRAMQVFSAMYNYSNYAKNLNDGENIPQCSVIYPTNSSETTSYYANSQNVIHLGHEGLEHLNGVTVAGSWDVIGHEYGHHLQYHYFYHNIGGSHIINESSILNYMNNSNYQNMLTDEQKRESKINGCMLGMNEAWPTFFAISAQSTFSNDIKTVPTVGDAFYSAYNFYAPFNIVSTVKKGEACEATIIMFLYHLWDVDNNESWDNISISDDDLWDIMCNHNPSNLSDFVNALYNSSLSFSRSDLGKLLEVFKISASDLSISSNSLANYSIKPTFTWIKNGQDIVYEGETYYYSNNRFTLAFYDSTSSNLILEKQNIYSNSYTLTQEEWNTILSSSGTIYYVQIKSYSTLGIETGPYYSIMYNYTKPNMASTSISINNSRYYENRLAIVEGTSWTFDVTFDHSGNKLFQTFGNKDTKMYLYYSDGITQVCNPSDDEGYGQNSYIYHYLQANTTYKLRVCFYNQYLSGMTKLSVMSVGGFKNNEDESMNSYECIWHIHNWQNYTFNSYVSQYNSMVVTFTPPVSGNYTISLDSEFDNYLYVIDPSSNNLLSFNVDYNDDSNGSTNASLTKNLETNKTYLIVFCQYNPSHIFSNLDSGDDIILRINKV